MNILAIDPGSTSTKIGIFDGNEIVKENFTHDRDLINSFKEIYDQKDFRVKCINNFLSNKNLKFDAVVGRGGLIKPVNGGVIEVNDILLNDLKIGVNGQHASNLGGIIADEIAKENNCKAYIVDPVVVDEMDDVAKLSGFVEVERKSIFHALNQKAMARRVADKLGKKYSEINLIVAHMGGGITVGAHKKGKVVDVNDGLSGDGPYAPERTGGLPVSGILNLLEKYSKEEIIKIVTRQGGIFSYLNIVDIREVEKIAENDKQAKLILDGMIYQIAKEIGALAAALDGEVDGIVLTGGIANSKLITDKISNKVKFISKIFIEPGEFEIEALIEGALRVLKGQEKPLTYK
jgi:butyrate kinase